ncbi:3-oxoacyl-ACP reductase FabG [Streptomyces sp. NPDC047002]|uniref:3-oxoacyl-ACP reductase FabG n=1 Tax=Streptomyces sp. NPDC047002 TaxID=3155475 RepID=UPI003453971B
MLLEGRTAVITGAATGIGRGIAARFGREGARIVVADIDGAAAGRAAAELAAEGVPAAGVRCDVTDEASVTGAVDAAVSAFGGLDVYVNNAGFTRDAVMRKMSVDDFVSVLHVHVLGAWLGTRAACAAMRAAGTRGSVVNMSSISGKVGNPGQTNYSAAKAGVVGLTKAAAKEAARYGVRVNAVQPGLVDTAMTAAMPPEVLAERVKDVPLGRIGEIGNVADAALFLASDLSSYITGTVVEVTGGRHM